MALLVAGCNAPTRLSRSFGSLWPFSSGATRYDKRDLADAVEKDPFPKASAFNVRVADSSR